MLSSRRGGTPTSGGGDDEEDPASTAASSSAEEPKTHPPATLTARLASYTRSLVSLSTSSTSFSSHCLTISLFIAFLFSLLGLSVLLRYSSPVACIPPYDPLARSVHFSQRLEGLASDFGSLGVPWCRSKQGRTVEWAPTDLIKDLEEFVPIYETRPIKNNMYGMGFDHSFGLWFMARWLKPDLMVESGAFKGHSTWVLRQVTLLGYYKLSVSSCMYFLHFMVHFTTLIFFL